MYYDSEAHAQGKGEPSLPFNPFKALVAPRPIGWITTLTADGTVNLAPYSYFQAVADNPDIVMFSAAPELQVTDGNLGFGTGRKDSQSNAAATGEFVCNMVSYDLRDGMNASSAHLPREVSEAEHAGLAMAPSLRVAPPRVAAAPAALECVVVDTHPVRHRGGDHIFNLVFGEVLSVYIDDAYVDAGRVNTAAMQLVTRMGYDEYAVLDHAFSMARPDFDPILDGLVK